MKNILKKIIKKESALYKWLSHVYNFKSAYWKPLIENDIRQILQNHINQTSEFTFIQIGSNDGKSNDPLHDFIKSNNCKGVFIEPVPYLFERLKQNYKNSLNLFFENIAIADENSFKDFYTIKEVKDNTLPSWYNQLSSFRLETIMSHKYYIPNLEQLIEKQSVPTLTLQTIIEKYEIKHLDILHVDTEGYDFEIIKTIDFQKFCPSILMFEHQHLSEKEYYSCLRMVRKYFRHLRRNSDGDTICY